MGPSSFGTQWPLGCSYMGQCNTNGCMSRDGFLTTPKESSFNSREKQKPFLQNIYTSSMVQPSPVQGLLKPDSLRLNWPVHQLNTDLHQVSSFRMNEAIILPHSVPSWHAQRQMYLSPFLLVTFSLDLLHADNIFFFSCLIHRSLSRKQRTKIRTKPSTSLILEPVGLLSLLSASLMLIEPCFFIFKPLYK